MKLHRFETPSIDHFAYLIADEGVAAIVDPRRDVDEYVELARELGVRIEYVIETHRHEDFVIGSTELCRRVDAKVVNGLQPGFGRGDLRLADGEELSLGRLRIRALYTPGHTPESTCWVVFPPDAPEHANGPERPWGVFTGDTLLFGSTGRTDLGEADPFDNAASLRRSVRAKLAPLADTTLVWPAHGRGSVCAGGVAERLRSTLGDEKRDNPVFVREREAFIEYAASTRLPRPPYFSRMARLNAHGGIAPVFRAGDLPLLSPDELAQRSTDSVVIDTREPEAFASGHIPGAYSVWTGGLPVFGGWIASGQPSVYLCTDGNADVDEAVRHLSRVGVDGVRGALRGGFPSWRGSGRELARAGVVFPRELAARLDEFTVLDVRGPDEVERGWIPGAIHVHVGELEQRLASGDLKLAPPVAVTCSVGYRSSLALSMLLRAGVSEVHNLLGGMTAWQRLELPIDEPFMTATTPTQPQPASSRA